MKTKTVKRTNLTLRRFSIAFITMMLIALMTVAIISSGILTNNSVHSGGGVAGFDRVTSVTQITDMFSSGELTGDFLDLADNDLPEITGQRRVIIEFYDEALLEIFNSSRNLQEIHSTPSDYFVSPEARDIARGLENSQRDFLRRLNRQNLDFELNYHFTGVMNAVSITMEASEARAISEMPGVRSVKITSSFYAPQFDEVSVRNMVHVLETGIYDTRGLAYQGEGMVISVLDTGIDYRHPAFADFITGTYREMYIGMTRQDVIDRLPFTVARATLPNEAQINRVHVNNKIPFMFDYADRRANAFPRGGDSHGTHVAGIIAGYQPSTTPNDAPFDFPNVFNENYFRGVVPQAQIVKMKVFSAYRQGAEFDDILAGVEDSVILGVDVINMSLGRPHGFSREYGDSITAAVYDRVIAAGINLVVAAGNSATSGTGSPFGSNLTSNPDSGTVGSPASYIGAMAVGNISGQLSPYGIVNGVTPAYINEFVDAAGRNFNFINELLTDANGNSRHSGLFNYITIPGYGEPWSFMGLEERMMNANAAGNPYIVIVRRGGNITFEQKARTAFERGAGAVIIDNNVPGMLTPTLGAGRMGPTALISMYDGNAMRRQQFGTIYFSRDQFAGPFMVSSSSWGPTPDLRLKPEITAHGGDIIAPVVGGYGAFSGTSMAAPNVAGAAALLAQHISAAAPIGSPLAGRSVERMHKVNRLLMSTSTMAMDRRNIPYSPRRQGSGVADIGNALNTPAYLYVQGTEMPKLELGSDPERLGNYTLRFSVQNRSNETQTYTLEVITMTEVVAPCGVAIAEQGYLLSPGVNKSASGSSLSGNVLTVPASQSVEIIVHISLSASDRAYMDAHFENGIFVDGFVRLNHNEANANRRVDLSIPFLAFYGDWLAARMFDYNAFEVSEDYWDDSIEPEDKRRANTFASIPVGRVDRERYEREGRSGSVPLGSFVFRSPEFGFREPRITTCRVAVGNAQDGVWQLAGFSAGMLRGAREVEVEVYNVHTGEVILERVEQNVLKQRGFIEIEIDPFRMGLPNNSQWRVNMTGRMDYHMGHTVPGNTETFDFFVDYQVPEVVNSGMRTFVDGFGRRTIMLDLDVFDNNYVQAVQLFSVLPNNTVHIHNEYPIPVRGQVRGEVSRVAIDITEWYYSFVNQPSQFAGTIGVFVSDYALNQSMWLVPINHQRVDDMTVTSTHAGAVLGEDGNLANLNLTTGALGRLAMVDFSMFRNEPRRTTTRVIENGEPQYYPDGRPRFVYETVLVPATGASVFDLDFTVKDEHGNLQDENNPIVSVFGSQLHAAEVVARRPGIAYVYAEAINGQGSHRFRVTVVGDGSFDLNATWARFGSYIRHRVRPDGTVDDTRYLIADARPGGDRLILNNGQEITLEVNAMPWHTTTAVVNPEGQITDENRVIRFEVVNAAHRPFVDLCENTGRLRALAPHHNISIRARINIPGQTIPLETLISIGIRAEFETDMGFLHRYNGPGFTANLPEGTFEVTINGITGRLPYGSCPVLSSFNADGSVLEAVPQLIIPANIGAFFLDHWSDTLYRPFFENRDIRSVVVPHGVRTIGRGAFAGSSVEVVFLPLTLDTIQDFAFTNSNIRYVYWLTENARFNEFTRHYGAFRRGYEFVACATEAGLLRVAVWHQAFASTEPGLITTVQGAPSLVQFDTSRAIMAGIGAFLNERTFRGAPTGENGEWVLDLRNIRHTGALAFAATAVENILFDRYTFVSTQMFASTPVREVDFFGSTIPSGMFMGATLLTRFTAHNDLDAVGNQAFANTPRLTDIEFNGRLTSIGSSAFAESGITSITLPNGFTTLGSSAFFLAQDLTRVYVSDGARLLNVGDDAFTGTFSLQHIVTTTESHPHYTTVTFTMPGVQGGVFSMLLTNDRSRVVILPFLATMIVGSDQFPNLSLSNLLENIIELDFMGNGNITHIADGAFSGGRYGGDVLIIPEGITHIGANAFMGNNFTKLILPTTLEYVGEYAFAFNPNLETVVILSNNLRAIPAGMFAITPRLQNIQLPDSVEVIGAGAFRHVPITSFPYQHSLLTSLRMPTNLREIHEFAFEGSGIQALEFDSLDNPQLRYIGFGAFLQSAIRDVYIPDGVTHIGAAAFWNTEAETVRIPGSVRSMGNFAFATNFNLHTVVVEEGVEVIGAMAFAWVDRLAMNFGLLPNSVLTSVTLPNSVRLIGQYAFAAATELRQINLSGVEEIHARAFFFNFELGREEITFSQNLAFVSTEAFRSTAIGYHANNRNLVFPNLEVIGTGAFMQLAYLESIVGERVEVVATQAFAFSPTRDAEGNLIESRLHTATFPNVEFVMPLAFSGTRLTEFHAPHLRMLGTLAFMWTDITEFYIGANLETLAEGAFVNAPIERFILNTNNNRFFMQGDYLIYRFLPNGRYEALAFASGSDIATVVVRENTSRVAMRTFAMAFNITHITLPGTLTTIGAEAFMGVGMYSPADANGERVDFTQNGFRSFATIEFRSFRAPALESMAGGFDRGMIRYGSHNNFGIDQLGIMQQNFMTPANGVGFDSFIFASMAGSLLAVFERNEEHSMGRGSMWDVFVMGRNHINSMQTPEVIGDETAQVIARITILASRPITLDDSNEIRILNLVINDLNAHQRAFIHNMADWLRILQDYEGLATEAPGTTTPPYNNGGRGCNSFSMATGIPISVAIVIIVALLVVMAVSKKTKNKGVNS